MKTRNPILFYTPLITAIVSLSIFFIALVNGWMGAPGDAGTDFCERGYTGLIKQPVNTWSNIGFIITGIYIGYVLWRGKYSENNNPMTRTLFFPVFFSCLAVLLGPGSMAMHATTTRVGGFLDMLSMYLVASFLFAYATQRFLKAGPLVFSIAFVLILISCLYMQTLHVKVPFVGFIGSFVFGIYLILTFVIESMNSFILKLKHEIKWGLLAVLAMVIAFTIWQFSNNSSPFCDPSSIVQGHGIWHILNALSVYCLFRFYVSEKRAGE